VDDGRPLQLVVAAGQTAPDLERLLAVDLVPVVSVLWLLLARQPIGARVDSGQLEQLLDLFVGLVVGSTG